MNDELERILKEAVVAEFKEGLSKTTNVIRDNWSPGRDIEHGTCHTLTRCINDRCVL
jgi:hypothetical protein